jgi:oligoendopeptidase F
MFTALPQTAQEITHWAWPQIEPCYHDLETRLLTADNVREWLSDWTSVSLRVSEMRARLSLANTRNTTDAEAEKQYHSFLDNIYPTAQAAEQKLKQKLLASRLEPEGMQVPLRNMRAEAELFREANLPLLTEERKLSSDYDKIIGAQTARWEGQELTIAQLGPVYQNPDRVLRERAWLLAAERQLADREAIGELWAKFMAVRRQLPGNAGLLDYRTFRWRQLLRFDYIPSDCASFQRAIEQVVVPAATRIYEKRRKRLGFSTLRPWDLNVDPVGRPPLRPFRTLEELESKTAVIFQRVDPQLGEYFQTMRQEGLLDLDNRKGKAPGGYCTEFPVAKRPFIFANSVGLHDDVQTLLHEGGHAFHVFETSHLPYHQQQEVGMEFAEVASMGMELLAAPYLRGQDSFYSDVEATRARQEHLEGLILFWPYMAVVDAFQHWVYEHHAEATDARNCDAAWADLWRHFMPGVDWSGLDDVMMTGWQRKLHIHQYPFYYVEYGLAQLGAVQVWRNALRDQADAVARYRKALSLGGTVTLPELYAAAGATFAFDADILHEAVRLIEKTIDELEAAGGQNAHHHHRRNGADRQRAGRKPGRR